MNASIAEFRKAEVGIILAKFLLSSSYDEIHSEMLKVSRGDSIPPNDFKKVLKTVCHATAEEIERVLSLVLTGEGKFFSAGADIVAFQKSIEEGDSVDLIRELTDILHPLLIKMRTSKTIIVAALNGASAGISNQQWMICNVWLAASARAPSGSAPIRCVTARVPFCEVWCIQTASSPSRSSSL